MEQYKIIQRKTKSTYNIINGIEIKRNNIIYRLYLANYVNFNNKDFIYGNLHVIYPSNRKFKYILNEKVLLPNCRKKEIMEILDIFENIILIPEILIGNKLLQNKKLYKNIY